MIELVSRLANVRVLISISIPVPFFFSFFLGGVGGGFVICLYCLKKQQQKKNRCIFCQNTFVHVEGRVYDVFMTELCLRFLRNVEILKFQILTFMNPCIVIQL